MKWWLLTLVACTSNPAAHETGPNCGDGVCEGDETVDSCAQDCARCGDLVCSDGEDHASCPVDCKAGCAGGIEDCVATCGDDVCSGDETLESCPADCWVCGDGMCTGPETQTNCAADCTPTPPESCGDGTCNADETVASCAADCSTCGDAMCTGSETYASCAADCGAKLKIVNNSTMTWYYFYAWQCGQATSTTNLLTSALPPSYNIELDGVAPGCWNLQAWNSGKTTYWYWSNVNLTAGTLTTETGN